MKKTLHSSSHGARRLAMVAVATAATALLALGAAIPAQAATLDNNTTVAGPQSEVYNTYVVQNQTDQTLTLETNNIQQPGGTDPNDPYITWGKGFGIQPPDTIPAHSVGKFSVPAYESALIHDDYTNDHTTLTYDTSTNNQSITFSGQVGLSWDWGIPTFQSDASFCHDHGSAYSCHTLQSTAPGGETVFTLHTPSPNESVHK